MHPRAGQGGDFAVAVDHRGFGGDGVSRQAEPLRDHAFVHHAALTQTRVFGVRLNNQTQIRGVFAGAAHQMTVLYRNPVVGQHHRARLP